GRERLCAIIRDLFGALFDAAVDDRLRAPETFAIRKGIACPSKDEIGQMVQSIYDQRDFTQLNRLAVVLEAHGFREALVQHCASAEGHFRGCWAVDELLRKLGCEGSKDASRSCLTQQGS